LRLGSDQTQGTSCTRVLLIYMHTVMRTKALKHLEIAEKSLPNNVEILVEKAAIIVTRGRWEEYITLLEKALQLCPNDISILNRPG